MTDMVFSAGALDANRAGRLSPDQLRDLQAGVRYRRRGLVGHLLHSGDAFAQDMANGRVVSVEGAITKKIWQVGFGGDSVAPPSYQIWVASRQAISSSNPARGSMSPRPMPDSCGSSTCRRASGRSTSSGYRTRCRTTASLAKGPIRRCSTGVPLAGPTMWWAKRRGAPGWHRSAGRSRATCPKTGSLSMSGWHRAGCARQSSETGRARF